MADKSLGAEMPLSSIPDKVTDVTGEATSGIFKLCFTEETTTASAIVSLGCPATAKSNAAIEAKMLFISILARRLACVRLEEFVENRLVREIQLTHNLLD